MRSLTSDIIGISKVSYIEDFTGISNYQCLKRYSDYEFPVKSLVLHYII